jgi:hypothetical protein
VPLFGYTTDKGFQPAAQGDAQHLVRFQQGQRLSIRVRGSGHGPETRLTGVENNTERGGCNRYRANGMWQLGNDGICRGGILYLPPMPAVNKNLDQIRRDGLKEELDYALMLVHKRAIELKQALLEKNEVQYDKL